MRTRSTVNLRLATAWACSLVSLACFTACEDEESGDGASTEQADDAEDITGGGTFGGGRFGGASDGDDGEDDGDTSSGAGFGGGGFGGGSAEEPDPIGLPEPVFPESAMTINCESATCRDVIVGDIVVEPCCPIEGEASCGLDLASVSEFMPVRGECLALEAPGSPDAECPSVAFEDAADPREFDGCCMPNGRCGVTADLSTLLADFGCVDPRDLLASVDASMDLRACEPQLVELDGGADPEDGGDPDDGAEDDAGTTPDAGAESQVDASAPAEDEPGGDPIDAGTEPGQADSDAALARDAG